MPNALVAQTTRQRLRLAKAVLGRGCAPRPPNPAWYVADRDTGEIRSVAVADFSRPPRGRVDECPAIADQPRQHAMLVEVAADPGLDTRNSMFGPIEPATKHEGRPPARVIRHDVRTDFRRGGCGERGDRRAAAADHRFLHACRRGLSGACGSRAGSRVPLRDAVRFVDDEARDRHRAHELSG